ncbi:MULTISPECIES: hypothetical protein [Pseudomonadaceae]|uniref:hypothetical protein n=1 Tax=Pseudomonadaceae TaxID=135621 RepID=UPI0015E41D6C|nr:MULTISPECIES: hypothetical protein [Pseudomonadaceae]MBA1280566.1 hypothetical protein [Stutzerimonas stutzeri]MBH8610668.1 hypothetical protein [Pseudomonas mohnii]
MKLQLTPIKPGTFPPELFDALLTTTRISGVEVIAALRAHFVQGMSRSEAAELHGASLSHLSRRAKDFQAKATEFEKLSTIASSLGIVDQNYQIPTDEVEAQSLRRSRAVLDSILSRCVEAGYDGSTTLEDFIAKRLRAPL